MQLRRFASVSSALAVAVVATTGILGFVSSNRGWVLAVHSIVGGAFVAFVALHVAHNARPLVRAMTAKRRRAPSPAVVVALAIVSTAVVLACVEAGPVGWLLAWSKQRREADQPAKYTTIELDPHGDGPRLVIDLKAGPSFRFFAETAGFEVTPQIAVWIEDEAGHYLETLYVTHDEGKADYTTTQVGRVVRRPEALPVWGHARGVPSPTRLAPLPDAVTSASPSDSAYIVTPSRTAQPRFVLLVEVNNSFDFNDYYRRDAFPDDPIYSGDGQPGQPSAVYRGVIDTASPQRFTVLALAGHGHLSGRDGRIDPDVSHMTTGLEIVDRVVVEVVRR